MLYIVATPIGNIEDTSLRAVKKLIQSDVLLVEDTATFDSYYKRIQSIFCITAKENQKIIHFHKENEFLKIPECISLLKEDKLISLVSESGLPTISDPGYILIDRLIKMNIKYSVIPGPTAFTTAAVMSGFPLNHIIYLGFLPKKEQQIIHLINNLSHSQLINIKPTIVFYESPHRIKKTLEIIYQILPDCSIAVCREMTKKFEEIIRGDIKNLKKEDYKGELTVVIQIKS